MTKTSPEVILITNSIYPYHLHNVAILSLPFGATYHFRYERRYFQLDSHGIDALKGTIGILVLRDYERCTFIPLRSFRVLAVDDCGEFVFLDLEFLHFVEYAGSRSEADAGSSTAADSLLREREKHTQTIEGQVLASGVANTKGQHLAKLILSASSSELARITTAKASEGGQFADAWSHVVTVLGGMAVYERVCFYVVSTVLELNGAKSASRFSGRQRAGLVLKTGKVYLIRVYQLMGNRTAPPRPGFQMRLTCIEGHLSPLRSEITVDGAYDRLSFVVSVLPQEREKNQSELLVTCNQSVPDQTDSSRSSPLPTTPLELQIQWPLWARVKKWAVYPVLLLLGAGLFVMADKIQCRFTLGETGKYLLQLIGLTLLALGGKNWGFLTGAFKSGPPGTRA
jgi:hypothetical protein